MGPGRIRPHMQHVKGFRGGKAPYPRPFPPFRSRRNAAASLRPFRKLAQREREKNQIMLTNSPSLGA